MESNIIPLCRVPIGRICEVFSIDTCGSEKRRLIELGLIQGTCIEALHKSPSGDPVAYFIRGAVIALREDSSRTIMVSMK